MNIGFQKHCFRFTSSWRWMKLLLFPRRRCRRQISGTLLSSTTFDWVCLSLFSIKDMWICGLGFINISCKILLHNIFSLKFVIPEHRVSLTMDKTRWTRNIACSFSCFRSFTFLSQGDIWSLNTYAKEGKEDVNLHHQYSRVFEQFDPQLGFSSTSGSFGSDLQSHTLKLRGS
jgi:hypothetical protein